MRGDRELMYSGTAASMLSRDGGGSASARCFMKSARYTYEEPERLMEQSAALSFRACASAEKAGDSGLRIVTEALGVLNDFIA